MACANRLPCSLSAYLPARKEITPLFVFLDGVAPVSSGSSNLGMENFICQRHQLPRRRTCVAWVRTPGLESMSVREDDEREGRKS